MKVEFHADKVKVKTGYRVDNSSIVEFEIGEYESSKLKDLIGIVDKNLKVTVEIHEN